ncbi:lipoprotein-releasing ABC transporter ATP-binding protein LolD [Pleionea mediterranea]|jgi:lipoprotein-releasing system ATP-binding protein|uniref:Lipoprotein-releasing system ATP-binding protein LolD n=1 Tax=Pleionea mediterranea TaxID=523701 RepID=A0A316G8Z9_9GAMM|nr:lipoprotein-releasing ABC transporter ATP-binding protein LolD [Pleionea mediterranea]PWK50947.1 lipoprotein-releasing system ATP-binding protein [Pleionea mediterranea]
MNNQTVLECHKLTKHYLDAGRKVEVLRGIDLQVDAGESLSIIGASGSGKSTLLHLLGGLDQASSGDVVIMGKNIHQMNAVEQGKWRNHHLGFIYQFHHLLAEFSALENVAMPLLIRGISKSDALTAAKEMIGKVGLSERVSHKPSELSGGERQRIAIARALVTRPACILADEPTGNLDEENAEKVYQLMLDLNRELNTSLIVVTHDRTLASRASRQLTIVNGQIESIPQREIA